MAEKERPSLTEFVTENPDRGTCSICNLPEIEELTKAKQNGTANYRQMARWLVAVCGHPNTPNLSDRIGRHFSNNHQARLKR